MGSLLVKIKRQVDSLKETVCTEMPENDIKTNFLSYKNMILRPFLSCSILLFHSIIIYPKEISEW